MGGGVRYYCGRRSVQIIVIHQLHQVKVYVRCKVQSFTFSVFIFSPKVTTYFKISLLYLNCMNKIYFIFFSTGVFETSLDEKLIFTECSETEVEVMYRIEVLRLHTPLYMYTNTCENTHV